MLDKIEKVKYFDGMAYRTYEVGKDNVTEIDFTDIIAKVTIKDFNGKRYILIKSEYMELTTKDTF
ncbi:hypothetical protein ACTQ5F_07990 [Jeotgalibaca porci]|uniref:hypothetical protein n=1 Tax=Jeotgalibaca porci TaxID=1868793 RepID=UPI003F8E046C